MPVVRVTPHVRWMIRRDMPQVMDIERSSFESQWEEDDFLHCLREKHCIGLVAERYDQTTSPDGLVVGYMVYEIRRASMRVLNFAVHPDHRRLGVGRFMCERLAYKLKSHRRRRLVWYVNEHNLDCQLFLRDIRLGFTATRCVKNFYDADPRDVYRFELDNPEFEERNK